LATSVWLNRLCRGVRPGTAAVIFKDDADKFPNVDTLTGKVIDITGRVKDYKGSCEIIVNGSEQLKIK
jgi:DNA/RNA endonuclease YhcR with UshA esterase domain